MKVKCKEGHKLQGDDVITCVNGTHFNITVTPTCIVGTFTVLVSSLICMFCLAGNVLLLESKCEYLSNCKYLANLQENSSQQGVHAFKKIKRNGWIDSKLILGFNKIPYLYYFYHIFTTSTMLLRKPSNKSNFRHLQGDPRR